MLSRAAIAILLALMMPAVAQARDLEASYPANDLEVIQITAGVGEIILDSGSDANIRVEVELKSSDEADADVDALIDEAELVVTMRNGKVELEIVFPGQSASDDDPEIQQKWRVLAPQSLAAIVEIGVGVVDVSGLGGGVEASIGVGETRVDVPGGSLRLKTSVGEVSVRSGSGNIGDVDLDSNIGEVSLRVNGDDIDPQRSMFVGSRLSWSGGGDDDIDVRVNVGQIDVRLD